MADPVSLTALSIGASAASAGVGAYGSFMGGQSKSAMYNYQAGIAEMNRKIQKQNSEYAYQAGEKEANISGMKSRALMGKIVTGQAASGIDVNSGSNQLVQEGQTKIARMDQAQIRENAGRKARGYDVAAVQEAAQANVYRAAGANAEREGEIGAITSILGGVSSVSSKWQQAKTAGIYS